MLMACFSTLRGRSATDSCYKRPNPDPSAKSLGGKMLQAALPPCAPDASNLRSTAADSDAKDPPSGYLVSCDVIFSWRDSGRPNRA